MSARIAIALCLGCLILTSPLAAQSVEQAAVLPAPETAAAAPPTWNAQQGDVVYWYHPAAWFPPEFWETSFEVGLNGSSGNSDTLSLRTGIYARRKSDRSIWDLALDYAYTKAEDVVTQDQALLATRYEWLLGESPWSIFTAATLEYNAFRAFDYRLALNGGLGYTFIENDVTRIAGRFGAGASREFGGPDDDWVPEAVFGLDFDQKVTARQRLIASIDYYPAWDDFADYRILTDISWELLLDESMNMSLKVGVIDAYDATPNGREPNDLNYAVLLLWKL